MRVVSAEGEQLGVMQTHEAIRLAEEKGLDLVEISPRAFPPVCKIMDYGKYKYEQAKQTRKAKKHASTVEIKEIKFRPKTEGHDMDFKVKHVRRFLEEGNKVRLAVVFRGREITHPQTGMAVLNRVVEATADLSSVEVTPNMEGRRMIMVIAPKPGVVRKAQEAIITLMIEAVMSKRRILELYLNVAEWGEGVFGAEAAARYHFGSSAAQLSTEQAAYLAAILPSPRKYVAGRQTPYIQGRIETIRARMPAAQIP